MEKYGFIVCAANYYNDGIDAVHKPKNIETGYVICGHRHYNCIEVFARIYGFPYSKETHKIQETEVQGFLTSNNYFVDRVLGLEIARFNNQLKAGEPIIGNRLFSENLY